MVSIVSLWLPILLAAVLVFLVSSVIHMALGYHAADWKKLPSEDEVQAALRRFNIPPGDYMLPCPETPAAARSPEFLAKRAAGPRALVTTWAAGSESMGKSLALWFAYSIVVGVFAAYAAGAAFGPGTPYLAVFRLTGTVAFAGYSLALVQHSIWYQRSWATTARSVVDGLIYALITAGTFGWLWP